MYFMSSDTMELGLSVCFSDWDASRCWEKLMKFLVDLLMVLVCCGQLFVQCRREWSLVRVRHWLNVMIILSIASNMFHQVFYSVNSLFDIETFFFNVYFVTLLYYAGSKLITKIYLNKALPVRILRGTFGALLIIHIALFISSLCSTSNNCVDQWYLIVRTIGFVMAIILTVMGRFYEVRARNKLQNLESFSIKRINNPLPQLWFWVIVNLVAQMVNIVKSFVFAFVDSLECRYDKNNVDMDSVADLIISLVTFYLPLMSTIYMFWLPFWGQNLEESVRRESYLVDETDRKAGVQLIAMVEINRDSL